MASPDSRQTRKFTVHLRFFWQLILAFVLIIFVTGGGTILAGRLALRRLENYTRENPPAMTSLWVDRLANYYARRGSWEGVEALIADYPCGSDWGPWDQGWQEGYYALTTPDGVILAANDENLVGRTFRPPEVALAVPVVVEGRQVGLLSLSPFGRMRNDFRAMFGTALQRFLMAGALVGGLALLAGLGISRVISRPLVELTEAARAVADGDLGVRVPVRYHRYHDEVRELSVAFNRMTEELARADNMRRNMTADVAHELRTPLSVIRGKLEGVLDGVYPATPQHLEPVLEEAELLTRLVEDLRLLAMAEAGQLTLEKGPMHVGDLLQDTYVNFSPQAADRGVTLALDLPPEIPEVSADRRRISQVLGNLLTNALRHTPEGGCVTLSAATDADGVEVAVADTGTGIPPEDLPYVFERFWRGDKSRSRAGGGSGLGLAIARQLVEMHGGHIRAASTPGQGSRFSFILPVRSQRRSRTIGP
jgi:signal transduction histidine kinase